MSTPYWKMALIESGQILPKTIITQDDYKEWLDKCSDDEVEDELSKMNAPANVVLLHKVEEA
jgi:hypothetical protein